jgi:hypothetical protein
MRDSNCQRSAFVIALILAAVLVSCQEPFEPKGPFEEKLVVYGILSTHTDTQYVRLYTTYDPEGFDPTVVTVDHPILGATVTLTGSGASWRYRDTTVVRWDKSRYTSDIQAYVLVPFRPVQGSSYTLTVQLPNGKQARGTTSVPGKGYLSVVTLHVLDRPESFAEDLYVVASIAPGTRGFLVRMFVEFELTVDGERQLRRVEVPMRIRRTTDGVVYEKIYPKLQRRTSSETSRNQGSEYVGFQHDAYLQTLNDIAVAYVRFNPVRKNVIFVLTQTEANLYNYFNIVNGFQDDITIRTDQPDFSSIDGGVGVFGAMSVDSLVVSYR